MHNAKRITTIHFGLSIVLLLAILSSCSSARMFESAKKMQDMGEYNLAIAKYRKAYKKEKNKARKTEMAFRLADCYRSIGEYSRAEAYYKTSLSRDYPDSITRALYAEMLLSNGKSEKAIEQFEHYLRYNKKDKRAQNGLQSSLDYAKKLEIGSRVEIEKMKIINSKNSDYGAVYMNGRTNEIVFTSTRDDATGKRKSNITGAKNGDLFVSWFNVQRQKWEKPELFEETEIINTVSDEGVVSFAANGSEIYFTRCIAEKNKENTAQIFSSTGSGENWSDAKLVTFGGDSLMAAHPSISMDGDVLYFVSDRPGGYGGKDIWRSHKNGNAWSRPENMGPEINTPGDEMFPFIRENGELYFSSNYHPGMGGLDIFKATYIEEEYFWQVENMGAPMNDYGDDFSIFFLPGEDQGIFSSRRKGTAHDDIFTFFIPPIEYFIEGEVVNAETEERINEATIRIVGTDGTMQKINSRDGKFSIKVNPDSEYIVAAYKKGFLNAKNLQNTIGLTDSKTFTVALALTPTDAPIQVDNIEFEFGDYNLMPASKNSLDSLVSILNSNPTIQIELMAHTDFTGESRYNLELSQKRAQSVIQYVRASGISAGRLVAKGYGESSPKVVNEKLAEKYEFLKEGDILSEEFILSLPENEQEICNQLNRRTEFRVLSNNYRGQ